MEAMTLVAKSGTAISPCLAELSPLCAILYPRDRTFSIHLHMPCYSRVTKVKVAGVDSLSPLSLAISSSAPSWLLLQNLITQRLWADFADAGASSTSFRSKPGLSHLHSSETSNQTDPGQAGHQPSPLESSFVISIADPCLLAGTLAKCLACWECSKGLQSCLSTQGLAAAQTFTEDHLTGYCCRIHDSAYLTRHIDTGSFQATSLIHTAQSS